MGTEEQGGQEPTLEEQLATALARGVELAEVAEQRGERIEELTEALAELRAESGVVVRYAVFDTRYDKFVGEVTTKKPSLPAAKKLVGHDDVEVREV